MFSYHKEGLHTNLSSAIMTQTHVHTQNKYILQVVSVLSSSINFEITTELRNSLGGAWSHIKAFRYSYPYNYQNNLLT